MYNRYFITGAVTILLLWLCEDLKNCRINILRWQIGCIIQTQKVEGGGGGEENLHSKCTPVFHTKNAVPSYAWILLQNFWTLPHGRRGSVTRFLEIFFISWVKSTYAPWLTGQNSFENRFSRGYSRKKPKVEKLMTSYL